MADAFQLRIVTPNRLLLDESVREVTAPGALGEFGVLPNHITFLGVIETGTLRYRTDRGAARVAVRGGFAEVIDNVMTVLADDAQFPEDIDVSAAQKDVQEAEAQMRQLSPLDDDYTSAESERRWAQALIETARG
jgi:F-type H+-transporting ATPase subunit epsilon